MNKLLELLNSFVGEGKLTAEDLAKAKGQVETIKVKLSDKDSQIKELGDKLKPFEDAANDATLKEAFVKAGGHESKFDDFKDAGGNAENAADKLAKFASLKEEALPKYNGTNGGQSGNNGDGAGAGNGSSDDDVLDVA